MRAPSHLLEPVHRNNYRIPSLDDTLVAAFVVADDSVSLSVPVSLGLGLDDSAPDLLLLVAKKSADAAEFVAEYFSDAAEFVAAYFADGRLPLVVGKSRPALSSGLEVKLYSVERAWHFVDAEPVEQAAV